MVLFFFQNLNFDCNDKQELIEVSKSRNSTFFILLTPLMLSIEPREINALVILSIKTTEKH